MFLNPKYKTCAKQKIPVDLGSSSMSPDLIYILLNCDDSQQQLNYTETFYLWLQIADGQRDLIRSHSVKNRHFIGNTSMDAGLSFLMANHAKVKGSDLVFDPFVGTGELIISQTVFILSMFNSLWTSAHFVLFCFV